MFVIEIIYNYCEVQQMIKNIIWDIFISLFYDILFIIVGIELVYILLAM